MATIKSELDYIQEARSQLAEALITKFGVRRYDNAKDNPTLKGLWTVKADGSADKLKRLHDWALLVTGTNVHTDASLTFKNDGKGDAAGTTFNGSTNKTISYNSIGAAAALHTHSLYLLWTKLEPTASAKLSLASTSLSSNLGRALAITFDNSSTANFTDTNNATLNNRTVLLHFAGGKSRLHWNLILLNSGKILFRTEDSLAWKTVSWDGHTHTTTIATSTDTNQIALTYGGKYKLTAGGTSYVFTMPASDNTWRPIGTGATDAAAGNHVHKNLIIKWGAGDTEGTNLFTYNGSTVKTINLSVPFSLLFTSFGNADTGFKATNVTATISGITKSFAVNWAIYAGRAQTADKWTTARTLTIGNAGKSIDGSANVSWSLAEIGVSAAAHTHSVKINGATKTIAASGGAAIDLGNYLPLSGGTMTGSIYMSNSAPIIHTTKSSSNWIYILKLFKGSSASTTKYQAGIGWHNMGGNSNGALTLIPYAQDSVPWNGTVGLYITQNSLSFNGTSVSLAGHTHSYLPLSGGTMSNTNKVTNLNADLLDGLHVHSDRNNEANKIVRTDGSGYIQAGWINTTSGDMGTTAATRIYCSNDGYIRYKTPANFFETLANDGNQISVTVGSQNRKLTVNYANSADKSNYLTSRYIGSNGDTVAQVKLKILDSYTSLSGKQGYSILVNYSFIDNYSLNDYVIPASGIYSLTYLTPGYNGLSYGQWLAASFGILRLYVFGRNNSLWTERKTIAWTSDIPTVTNYYWANVKVSTSSNAATTPIFATATATTSVTTPLVSSTGRLTLNATNTALDLKFNNDDTKSVILSGTEFKPFDAANGKLDLGSTSARWKIIYGGSGNFTGNVISSVSNTDTVRHKVQNSNGAISILVSTNRGLYDETNGAWIIYLTLAANHVYIPKWASKGSSTLPVYFNSNGEPVACTAYSGLLTALSSSATTNLSITVGGTTKSITDLCARKLALSSTTITSTTDDTTTKWGPLGTSVHFYSKTGLLIDQPSLYGLLLNVTIGSDETHLIWMTLNTGSLYHRGGNASGWGGSWRTILDSSNYSSYLDKRYYTETEADNRFVNVTGDTMTGALKMSTGASILLWDDSATASHRLTLRCASDVGRIYNYTGSAYGTMHVGHDGTNAIVITSGLNVGIGTGSPSSKLHVNGNAIATNLGVNASGGGNGISLFSGSGYVALYGIAFNQTSNWGIHGYVTSDWATYFTMNNLNNRGWIFKRNGSGNVFSIDTSGLVYANGRINGNYYTSRVATGTQPYACTSTTLNTNLNADMLDGYHASSLITWSGALFDKPNVSWSNAANGVKIYSHHSSNSLGYYRAILQCKAPDNAIGLEFNAYWYVNPSDSASNNNIYYRVKRDSAADWGPYTKLLLSDGDATITGSYYANSDIRYKLIQSLLLNKVNSIAELPIFTYYWKDDKHDDKLHIGSSAQAVNEIFPELVTYDELKDFYNLDYATLGTIAGITACKELVNLKSEIEQLRERVAELEQKLNDYGIL